MTGETLWRIAAGIVALVIAWWLFTKTTATLVVNFGFSAPAAAQSTPTPGPIATAPAAPATAPAVPAAPATSAESALAAALSEMASASRENAQASREQATAFNRQAEAFDRLSGQLSGRTAPPPDSPNCPAGCVSGTQYLTPTRN